MKIYLAGPMTNWRDSIIKHANGKFEFIPIENVNVNIYESAKFIPYNDLKKLKQADIVIAYVPHNKQTIGTVCEMMYAKMNNIPIFSIAHISQYENLWLNWLSDEIFFFDNDINEIQEPLFDELVKLVQLYK